MIMVWRFVLSRLCLNSNSTPRFIADKAGPKISSILTKITLGIGAGIERTLI